MALADHLRELRYRLIVSVLAIVAMSLLAAVFYDGLYQVMLRPYLQAVEMLAESNPNLDPRTVITGVTTPLILAGSLWIGSLLGFHSDVATFTRMLDNHASLSQWTDWLLSDAAPAMVLVSSGLTTTSTGRCNPVMATSQPSCAMNEAAPRRTGVHVCS